MYKIMCTFFNAIIDGGGGGGGDTEDLPPKYFHTCDL